MKKMLLIVVALFLSTSLFAFDGTTNHSYNRDDYNYGREEIGFGIGYGEYTLDSGSNDQTDITGTALSINYETSYRQNSKITNFVNYNFLLTPTATGSLNGSTPESLVDFENSNNNRSNIEILAMDAQSGIHGYINIEDNLDLYLGAGLRFGIYDLNDPTDILFTSPFREGLITMGWLLDAGLQFRLAEDFSFNVGFTGGYDVWIYEYDDQGFYDSNQSTGTLYYAKILFTYNIQPLRL
jgi:hypothetical protein